MKGVFFFSDVFGDVEGVVLVVVEAVDDGAVIVVFFVDGLFKGLGFVLVSF